MTLWTVVEEIQAVWDADDAVIIAMHKNPFCSMADIMRVIPLSESSIRRIIRAWKENGWRNPRR